MNKTAEKTLKRQLAQLRKDYKAWRTGMAIPWWGVAWCPAGAKGVCTDPTCEGCATVAYCRDRASEIADHAAGLKAQLETPPAALPVQEALFT